MRIEFTLAMAYRSPPEIQGVPGSCCGLVGSGRKGSGGVDADPMESVASQARGKRVGTISVLRNPCDARGRGHAERRRSHGNEAVEPELRRNALRRVALRDGRSVVHGP